jgi:hypothetical protein
VVDTHTALLGFVTSALLAKVCVSFGVRQPCRGHFLLTFILSDIFFVGFSGFVGF